MAPWTGQQHKDHAVPQLSCVMCRDRKLKCDKLDPCTNCKASGAMCTPIHRPRLPRGRHARRARPKTPTPLSSSSHSDSPPSSGPPPKRSQQTNTRRRVQSGSATGSMCPATPPHTDTDVDHPAAAVTVAPADENLGTRIAALDAGISDLKELLSHVRKDQSSPPASQLFGAIGQDMSQFAKQLEKLLEKAGSHSEGLGQDPDSHRPTSTVPGAAGAQPPVDTTEDSQALSHLHPPSPPHLDVPGLSSPGTWSLGLSSDFWAYSVDYQTQDQGPVHALDPYTTGQDDLDTTLANSGIDCISGDKNMRLLGQGNILSVSSPVPFPRDTVVSRKLCDVYLQNVDPIIKILHRPTLTSWMIHDTTTSARPPPRDTSARALECAVCYAAATTMTETQCQAMFQKPKSDVSATHRKMCEEAIERAGLLTTRDMRVLQAFVLYLVGRRSEDKGTAVWALVALVVRLTSAMKLNSALGDQESFFHQQMRLRLWLTVCLIDLQAALTESSEPLISYRDAASAVPHVRNINDADFNVDTVHPVDSSEQLTDTTFALVTYRVQVIGRLLNFAAPEPGVSGAVVASWASSASSEDCDFMVPASARPLDPEGRSQLVHQFKQEVFGLLHYCDPESSAYAWFTWHSTHCIVAAIRLSEMLPFRCGPTGCQPQPMVQPPTQSPNEVLCRALQSLDKSKLIHSDPRSDCFRWYIAAPRLALSTALAECRTCADAAVVRWAWPIIESSFQQYEDSVSLYRCPLTQVPLVRLLSEARDRLAPLLQQECGVSLGDIQTSNGPLHNNTMTLDADGNGN